MLFDCSCMWCAAGKPGCIYSDACNYDALAVVDDGSCKYAAKNRDCSGNCLTKVDCKGVCGGVASKDFCGVCGGDNGCMGCMDKKACNYDPSAKVSNRKLCVYKPKVCGVCGRDAKACTGCGEASACNYDKNRKKTDNSKCDYAKRGRDCQGHCVAGLDCNKVCGGGAKYDACGVCGGNNSTCTGCMDKKACNYDVKAKFSGSCRYPAKGKKDGS